MAARNRIIFSDNGVLTDITNELTNIYSGSKVLPIVAAQDALYLGSELPWNSRYVEVSAANILTSAISKIEVYSGTQWGECVDVLDRTSVGGKTLAQSGILSFEMDRLKTWSRMDSCELITELSTLKIYNLYWLRITFTADITLTTALSVIGHKFCEPEALYAQYPDFNNSSLMTAFASGKTTWNEQILVATQLVIDDLIANGVMVSPNQILDTTVFESAAIHKTAEVIYRAMGDDNKDDLERARTAYNQAKNVKVGRIDENGNGVLDLGERFHQTGWMTR